MFHFPVKRKYCNKDCNWEGVPNGTPFKLWGSLTRILGIKLNSFRLEEKKRTARILVTILNLVRHLEQLLLPRICLLTAFGDQRWYWQWLIWTMDIEEYTEFWWCPCTRNGHISTTVPDTRYCSWIPDIRNCSRFADVRHWAKMLMLDTWPATTTQLCRKACSR